MAPPSKTVPHPGRALAALGALIVIMLLSLLGGNLFSPGQWHKDFRIGLGLDLAGGTQLSMKATTLSGGLPTSGDMQEAITIILARVNGTGNTGAEVQTEGANILNVSIPNKTVQQTANLVSETALLMFRQTLLFQAYTGPTASPSASASPSTTPSASASTSATASPSPSHTAATPSATPGATATASTSAKIVQASASPTASGTAASSPLGLGFGQRLDDGQRLPEPEPERHVLDQQHRARRPEPGETQRARAVQQAGLQTR